MDDENPRMRHPPSRDICGDFYPYPLKELKMARSILIDDLYFSPGGGRIVHRVREITGILPNRQGRFIWNEMFPEAPNYCEQSSELLSKSDKVTNCKENVSSSSTSETTYLGGYQCKGFSASQENKQDIDGTNLPKRYSDGTVIPERDSDRTFVTKMHADGIIGDKSMDDETVKAKSIDDKSYKAKNIDDTTKSNYGPSRVKSIDGPSRVKSIDGPSRVKSIDGPSRVKSIDGPSRVKSMEYGTSEAKDIPVETFTVKTIDERTIKTESLGDETIVGESIDGGTDRTVMVDGHSLNLRKRKEVNSVSLNLKKQKQDDSVDDVIEIYSESDISCEAFVDSVVNDIPLNVSAFKCDFCDYTSQNKLSIINHLNTKLHYLASTCECLSSKGRLTPNYLIEKKSIINNAAIFSSVVAICSICYCIFKDIYACAKHACKVHRKKKIYSLGVVRKLQTIVMSKPEKCQDTPLKKITKCIIREDDAKDQSYERPEPSDIVFCICPMCTFTTNNIVATKHHMLSHFDSKTFKTIEFKVLFIEKPSKKHTILPHKVKPKIPRKSRKKRLTDATRKVKC